MIRGIRDNFINQTSRLMYNFKDFRMISAFGREIINGKITMK